jgi:hypothetical protein
MIDDSKEEVWLAAITLDFDNLVIAEKTDSYQQNSSNKNDWIKQPRMKKLKRCVVHETPPIKVLDKPDKETEVI